MKYYYFGIVRFQEVDNAGSGRTKRVPVTKYGSPHTSFEKMMSANKRYIKEHPGDRFTWCVYEDVQMVLERGICTGFVDPDTGEFSKYLVDGKIPQ